MIMEPIFLNILHAKWCHKPPFQWKTCEFLEIITHLEFHIITLATSFHKSHICNHNLKVVNNGDITVCLFYGAMMDEIMGIVIVY